MKGQGWAIRINWKTGRKITNEAKEYFWFLLGVTNTKANENIKAEEFQDVGSKNYSIL